MNAERHQRIKEIFGALCDEPPAQRRQRLGTLGATDPELAHDVEVLLQHSDAPAFDIEDAEQLSSLVGEVADAPVAMFARPRRIGMYEIIDEIGQGGMGVVYLAQQHRPLERKVAIKVIRPGMDSRQVLTRFDMERRTLAAMNHPGIAAVHDAGVTEEGRPYFVMQHVEGERITAYCDANRLSIDARLDLFLKVCDAVVHAHQKGVIHRDLKASNILIEERDGVAVPKVIDFGVAKAMGPSAGEETMHTAPGQLIGTPQYMSPEQTQLDGMHVDTRSDVFSLGALLYELLCGNTPIDAETIRSASFDKVCRLIREVEAVPPSRRVEQLEPEEAQHVARHRSASPGELARTLRGELDWITRTAMEKEPQRRYESVSALAADIARFRKHEPVTAGPVSRRYRFRKFVRRHRGAVVATCAVTLALVAGAAAFALQARETRREADNTREIVQFLEDMLASANPINARGEDTTLREFMDHAGAQLWNDTSTPPTVRASLHNTIGATYSGLGDYEKAEKHFQASRDLSLELHGPLDRRTLRSIGNLVYTLHLLERSEEAYALGQENLQRAEASLGLFATETRMLITNLALAAEEIGELEEAERLYKLNVERCRTIAEDAPDYYQSALCNYGVFLMHHTQLERGAELLQESYDIATRLHGELHPTTLIVQTNMASLEQRRDKPEAARLLFESIVKDSRHVLGTMHPLTLARFRNLCITTMQVRRFDEAEQLLRPAFDEAIAQYGHAHTQTIALAELLVTSIAFQDRIQDAVNLARAEYDHVVAEVGADHPRARRSANLVAQTYDTAGDAQQYHEWLARAGETQE